MSSVISKLAEVDFEGYIDYPSAHIEIYTTYVVVKIWHRKIVDNRKGTLLLAKEYISASKEVTTAIQAFKNWSNSAYYTHNLGHSWNLSSEKDNYFDGLRRDLEQAQDELGRAEYQLVTYILECK